jgi:hypothetical protein
MVVLSASWQQEGGDKEVDKVPLPPRYHPATTPLLPSPAATDP